MKIAIVSGKGGAGKTTLATSLAVISQERHTATAYLDCDVEEPNGHLFLHPRIEDRRIVETPTPQVNEAACRAAGVCGQCGKACQFGAIVCLDQVVVVNADLCHGCGACVLACPAQAIREVPRRRGVVEAGHAGEIRFIQGRLDVGQAMATPIVKQVKALAPGAGIVLLDAPPGTACPAVETARGCDLVLLVAEATPFGFHDFILAAEMVQALGLRSAAVFNRVDQSLPPMRDWCRQHGMPVLGEVAADRQVAQAYAHGQMPLQAVPEFRRAMERLWEALAKMAGDARA